MRNDSHLNEIDNRSASADVAPIAVASAAPLPDKIVTKDSENAIQTPIKAEENVANRTTESDENVTVMSLTPANNTPRIKVDKSSPRMNIQGIAKDSLSTPGRQDASLIDSRKFSRVQRSPKRPQSLSVSKENHSPFLPLSWRLSRRNQKWRGHQTFSEGPSSI